MSPAVCHSGTLEEHHSSICSMHFLSTPRGQLLDLTHWPVTKAIQCPCLFGGPEGGVLY